MAERSKIEWTDHTFNPWRGCTHATLPDGAAHPGCTHCYAEAMAPRNPKLLGVWGANGRRVMAAPGYWDQPLRWNDDAAGTGIRQRVFCASLADVFEDWEWAIHDHQGNQLPRPKDGCLYQWGHQMKWATLDDLRKRLFKLIDSTPWLDWLLLTKRPQNIRRMMATNTIAADGVSWFTRGNVWLGTSVSNQATANVIPELLKCRDLARVLFLSCEPLLGPIDFGRLWNHGNFDPEFDVGIDWVIAGGESGHGARPCHPLWVRSLRDQCQAADVAFHFKQWGEWQPANHGPLRSIASIRVDSVGRDVTELPGLWDEADEYFYRVGKTAAGRRLDGREWSDFPAVEASR
jgi:protein gp37